MMKFTSFLFIGIILFGFIACKENDRKSSETMDSTTQNREITSEISAAFLISERSVGPFEVGDKIPQNLQKYQIQKTEQTRYTEEGPVEESVYILSQNGEKHLLLKPEFQNGSNSNKQTISEIFVLSEKYKTAENIGVNSTLEEFSNVYPDFEIWYTYVSDRYVAENANSSIQFLLNENDFNGKMEVNSVKTPLEISDFAKGTKIEKVRLYQ